MFVSTTPAPIRRNGSPFSPRTTSGVFVSLVTTSAGAVRCVTRISSPSIEGLTSLRTVMA
jgi:hypothetical protein